MFLDKVHFGEKIVRIMIVDDDVQLCGAVAREFQRLGYSVATATSCAAALRLGVCREIVTS